MKDPRKGLDYLNCYDLRTTREVIVRVGKKIGTGKPVTLLGDYWSPTETLIEHNGTHEFEVGDSVRAVYDCRIERDGKIEFCFFIDHPIFGYAFFPEDSFQTSKHIHKQPPKNFWQFLKWR